MQFKITKVKVFTGLGILGAACLAFYFSFEANLIFIFSNAGLLLINRQMSKTSDNPYVKEIGKSQSYLFAVYGFWAVIGAINGVIGNV